MAVKERLNDDLFAQTTMTFGEHLEELRVCLWRAIVGLVVGFLIGLSVANYVVKLIQEPLTNALKDFYENQSITRFEDELARAKDLGVEVPYDVERVRSLVKGQHLTFEPVFLEAGDVADQLRRAYPKELAGLQIQPNPGFHPLNRFGPLTVVAGDFSDPRAFAKQIVQAGGSETASGARRFWTLLDAAQQARLKEIAQGSAELSAEDNQALTEELAAMFDPLLDRADLYDKTSFAKPPLSDEAARLLARTIREPEESRRLNRLLFEESFPEAIPQTRADMLRLVLWRPIEDNTRVRPTALGAQEAFGIWVKAALVVGALIGSPWIFLQIWNFVAAGLYPHEKRYVYIFLPFSIGLFLAGAALAAIFVFEPVLTFLFTYNAWLGIDPDPRISEWLGFVLILPIGFGISFQLPLVMLFLERIGIFTVAAYRSNWRISVLVIFVVAMILTPADPYSMLLMAVPLTGLYALGVGLCKWMPRGRLFAHLE